MYVISFFHVRNHIKLMHVINSCRVSQRALYCVVDTSYGLGRSLGDCRLALPKGRKYQMVKYKLRATLGGQQFEQTRAQPDITSGSGCPGIFKCPDSGLPVFFLPGLRTFSTLKFKKSPRFLFSRWLFLSRSHVVVKNMQLHD